jgi:hypothetical protein
MSIIPPTEWAELGKIMYEERLQEAEQHRRLTAITSANSRSRFFNLGSLFKPKSDKPGQPIYPALSEGK